MHYDLIVIGSGPAGQKGAIAAAKMGKRVAMVERTRECIGGVCLHTGTVPSKTMREAILFLTGFHQRDVYTDQYNRKRRITMDDLRKKLNEVVHRERAVIQDQLERNYVDIYEGNASFVDPHRIQITGEKSQDLISGENVLIASGTKPSRPPHIPFDGVHIFDSDEILTIQRVPRSMIVIGGGVIGIEYGIMFAALGVKITIVDGRERLIDFCDQEIVDHLMFRARAMGITFRLGESVEAVRIVGNNQVVVELESQKRILAETAFFSVGREGDTESLTPAAAGLTTDKRGRIKCDGYFRTEVPHIFAVGDVIGFPSLASTSMEQGRQAADHIFGKEFKRSAHIPYGLYTIPEIAMVGKTEQDLTCDCIPFEIGVARFAELAKSQISGGHDGLMKLLFHRETRKLLGVHCIGEAATEIIHIGQAVMAFEGTIEYFTESVFNHPTMAESYKVAAFDGLNRLCINLPQTSSDEDTAESELNAVVSELSALSNNSTLPMQPTTQIQPTP